LEPSELVQAYNGIALPCFVSLLSCLGKVNAVISAMKRKKAKSFCRYMVHKLYLTQHFQSLRVLSLFPVSYQQRRLHSSVQCSATIKHSASHGWELYSLD